MGYVISYKYNIYICENNFIHISFDENNRFYMLGERIVITIVYIIYKLYFLNHKFGFYTKLIHNLVSLIHYQ